MRRETISNRFLAIQITLLSYFSLLLPNLAFGQNAVDGMNFCDPSPKLALFLDPENQTTDCNNIEDILLPELSFERCLRLIQPSKLRLVLEENGIDTNAPVDDETAPQLARLVGADYLLSVNSCSDGVSVTLVDVSTGAILWQEELTAHQDTFLTCAAIREKIIRLLELEPDITDRLTVGVTELNGREATAKSKTFNARLQKAIRERLRQQPWATVLPRQQATHGLTKRKPPRLDVHKTIPEGLPLLDLVVFTTLEQTADETDAKAWNVNSELFLPLTKLTSSFAFTYTSYKEDEAAHYIVQTIDQNRREQAEFFSTRSQSQLWRRQALYLMPRSSYLGGRYHFDCTSQQQRLDTAQAIRAWENVLLLEPNNTEAKLNLGMALVSFYAYLHSRRLHTVAGKAAEQQALRGSLLVEAAMLTEPSRYNCTTFAYLVGLAIPDRAVEICEFIRANQDMFKPGQVHNATLRLTTLRPEMLLEELDKAISNVQNEPQLVLVYFTKLKQQYHDSPDVVIDFAQEYTSSENAWVRFCAELTIAETLWHKREDPSCLMHFERAIEAHEGVSTVVSKVSAAHHGTVDDIYRQKIWACLAFGQDEKARETALRGAAYFLDTDRFNYAIDQLWVYCVTKALGPDDTELGLAICDAYFQRPVYHDYPDLARNRATMQQIRRQLVRAAYLAQPNAIHASQSLRIESNPVQIEILP